MKIINRRIPRELKANILRYLALFILILCGIYFVVSMVAAGATIENDASLRTSASNVEDGEFIVFAPLTSEEETDITDKIAVTLEKGFYLDYALEDDKTVRMFRNRESINLISVESGELAATTDSVAVEKKFAEANGISVGDSLKIGSTECRVSGIVTAPDYESVLENTTDTTADNQKFGLIFVTDELYQEIKETESSLQTETYLYFYKFSDNTSENYQTLRKTLKESQLNITEIEDDALLDYIIQESDEEELQNYDGDIKELFSGEICREAFAEASDTLLDKHLISEELTEDNYYQVLTDLADLIQTQMQDEKSASQMLELRDSLQELAELDFSDVNIDNLLSITPVENNPRIGEVLSDISIVKEAGMLGGLVILILIIYVISIFTIHSVDQESNVVGTLYAMGMTKGTLMKHYILLPVAVTFIGGLAGTIIGFTNAGIGVMVDALISAYSLPKMEIVHPIYLIVYGLVVPPVTSALVNILVLNKKLSQQPLALLQNQQKQNKVSKLKLKNWRFKTAFQFRQFIREFRCSIAIFIGVFLSTIMLMMSQYISVGLGNMGASLENDIQFQNMYFFKYPDSSYDEGERAYAKQLTATSVVDNVSTFEVTLLGIVNDSSYFAFAPSTNENEITVSSSVALKFNLNEGDTFQLSDENEDTEYNFTVAEIVPYSAGLYVFMNKETLLQLLDEDEDTYNIILSDENLDVDTEKIYSTIKKDDFISFVDTFVTNMSPMIYMMFVLSVVIFFVVLYLMMKVMIDHSAFPISMMRVFGYRENEIRRLYLDGNFITFIVSAVLSVPLSQKIMAEIWPQMVDHVAMGIDVHLSAKNYIVIFVTMLLVYLCVSGILNYMLYQQGKKPAETLKNRE
ncbi:MAG: ABC transporter permease [Ruminococcus sp.]|nr:ABC transporter permease [Ruminococcus sp.]